MTKILIDEAVVRQALEALDTAWDTDPNNADGYYFDAAAALRKALADAALDALLDKMADNARELGLSYEQPAQQDIPDLIAGALGVSRGTAYDMMREALAEQPAPAQWGVHQQLALNKMLEQPAQQESDPDELTIAYMSGVYEGKKAERKRIVNLLMIQHEAAKGAHNYWKVAANLIQAEVASDT
jgi:hypothetical protein